MLPDVESVLDSCYVGMMLLNIEGNVFWAVALCLGACMLIRRYEEYVEISLDCFSSDVRCLMWVMLCKYLTVIAYLFLRAFFSHVVLVVCFCYCL
jgi:hypothetical protein